MKSIGTRNWILTLHFIPSSFKTKVSHHKTETELTCSLYFLDWPTVQILGKHENIDKTNLKAKDNFVKYSIASHILDLKETWISINRVI